MKFTSPTLTVATLLALSPLSALAWVCGPGGMYGTWMTPYATISPKEISRQKEMFRRQQELVSKRMRDLGFRDPSCSSSPFGPRYELMDNPEKFQVALDVPGVLMQDIDITVQHDDDGQVLAIAGKRKALNDPDTVVSKFSKTFSLDATVDVDKFSAILQNGVLIVTAPKEMQRIQDTIRKIPVTEIEEDANVSMKEKSKGQEVSAKNKDSPAIQGVPIEEHQKDGPEETPGEKSGE